MFNFKPIVLESLILEGGNAYTPDGDKAEKVKISEFSDELYDDYRKDIIKLLIWLNNRCFKQFREYIWDNAEVIKNYNIISGSSNQFFKRSKEEYTKVKPSIGDIDIYVNETKKELVTKFLDSNIGKMFNGFIYLGSMKKGDYYNIFKAPKKYNPTATNIQIDFEFIEYDNNEPNEFDRFAKTTQWEDLSQNIKGLAKNALMRALYKNKYTVSGVVFQPKHDKISKSYKADYVPLKVYGKKGTYKKYDPVIGDDGEQKWGNSKLAYREIKEPVINKKLFTMFQEVFDIEPDEEDQKLMMSYVGLIQLIKKYIKDEKVIWKIYISFRGDLELQFDDQEKQMAIPVLNYFKKTFPFISALEKDFDQKQWIKGAHENESFKKFVDKHKQYINE